MGGGEKQVHAPPARPGLAPAVACLFLPPLYAKWSAAATRLASSVRSAPDPKNSSPSRLSEKCYSMHDQTTGYAETWAGPGNSHTVLRFFII
jgi:hypothetical protein